MEHYLLKGIKLLFVGYKFLVYFLNQKEEAKLYAFKIKQWPVYERYLFTRTTPCKGIPQIPNHIAQFL